MPLIFKGKLDFQKKKKLGDLVTHFNSHAVDIYDRPNDQRYVACGDSLIHAVDVIM